MKLLFSEFTNIYSTYTFAYGVYCYKESMEELPQIYERGFLPYSADYSIQEDCFYLARSLRIDLQRFADTSENRRIDRKNSALNIEMERVSKHDFDMQDPQFRSFCEEYSLERFKSGSMDQSRLTYVLERELLTDIFVFRSGERILGYVFAALVDKILHYWFSFYDTGLLKENSLGKWMMWRTIRWAKENQLRYVYLGTVYTPRGLYKVRDHQGAEFFDGSSWNANIAQLTDMCHADADGSERQYDRIKQHLHAIAPTQTSTACLVAR